jgi:hypothetical protein
MESTVAISPGSPPESALRETFTAKKIAFFDSLELYCFQSRLANLLLRNRGLPKPASGERFAGCLNGSEVTFAADCLVSEGDRLR